MLEYAATQLGVHQMQPSSVGLGMFGPTPITMESWWPLWLLRRGLLRLLGTFVGAAGAAIAGKSWICMVLWVAVLVFLQRRVVRPADSYSCVVAALTFVVVGMVNVSSAEIQARGIRRLSGIALGTASLFSGLVARAILHALASLLLGLRRRTKNGNPQQSVTAVST
mmetsp:Transcript_177988/g.564862  ORF Transcript_177988/g.564862 Transcript_177988/m.564862 type:complete len:167 (+) Transcript_177988:178-678(+)